MADSKEGNVPSKNIQRIKKIFYSQTLAPYIFILPFLLSFLIFFLYPTINTFFMSFHEVLGMGNQNFIGLTNYQRLFNQNFYEAIRTNTLYTIFLIIILIPLSMLFATLLNLKYLKGRNFFKSALFVPALTSIIVAGVAFRLLFGEMETAFVNSILIRLGFSAKQWTLNHDTGMFLMVSLASWKMIGIYMIYFISGLQAIPEELYESAEIDGANTISKFTKITLPLLKPISIYVLTILIFDGYRMFGESFVFWNEGMPGNIGLTIVRYIYQQAFQRNNMGFGSAIGIVLLAIVLTINLIQLRFFGVFKKEE
ncbi:MAG: sugar ABC transporter permease [Clostridiaceae bacterium]|nr:sugar ABC transporter permease [Clostridiaceae bacterium]